MSQLNFILLIAGTDLIKQPGISAAGASPELLAYTAALDSEFIYFGKTKTFGTLPVSPSGIVSPALISKACLNILNAKIHIIDLGAHIKPQCPHHEVYSDQSKCPSTAQALNAEVVFDLFKQGEVFGAKFKSDDEIIIAECVVGGTTTALGLLTGLGYDCWDLVSSSIPAGNHILKKQIIETGLNKLDSNIKNLISKNPLLAVSAFGDAMQAFASGLAISTSKQNIKTVLAGGSQMIAVKSLIDRITKTHNISIAPSPWVVKDKSAQFEKLHSLSVPDTPYHFFDLNQKLSNPDLDTEIKYLSRLACSREISFEEICSQYNQGHVKEGVGMGALLFVFQRILKEPLKNTTSSIFQP
jgi:uncharacterized protein (TIGR00303 family)